MRTKQNLRLLLIRVSIAFTMLVYGITKLIYGIDFIKTLFISYGLPSFFGYSIFIGEVIAPFLIIIGFRTKFAGIVFALNCFAAIIMVQLPNLLQLNESGGWSIGLIFIYMVFGISMFFTGAGKYALSTNKKWD
ncbi:MAG: DoxX family protein [Flavobacteriaceae bacterium]|nr:DoxX family protein [Flavobacteriaceae bacterium]